MENAAASSYNHVPALGHIEIELISPNRDDENPLLLYNALSDPLDKTFNRYVKRTFDILFSIIIIVSLISWLLPLLTLLILLDSKGPVFFRQKRTMRHGEVFTCVKLRTMHPNNTADEEAAKENDQRITRIGKMLRASHLDELPQFFHVLTGQMSVIGPRPYMLTDDRQYQLAMKQYRLRYKVKPGITGMAQAYGFVGSLQNKEEMKNRLAYDLLYIRRWSVMMDTKIVALTIFKMCGLRKSRIGH